MDIYTRLLHALQHSDVDLVRDVVLIVRPDDFAYVVRPEHRYATYDQLVWSYVSQHVNDDADSFAWSDAFYWPFSGEAESARVLADPLLVTKDAWAQAEPLWRQRIAQIIAHQSVTEDRLSVVALAERIQALGEQGRALLRVKSATTRAEKAQKLGVANELDSVSEALDGLQRVSERVEVGAEQRRQSKWLHMLDRLADPERPNRIAVPTGWAHVDASLRGGWGVGEFSIIAAGTSVGKSLITGAIARNVIWPKSVEFVQAKPSLQELVARLVAQDSDTHLLVIATESPTASYVQRWQHDLLHATGKQLDSTQDRAEIFAGADLLATMMAPLRAPDCRVQIYDRATLTDRYRGNGRELSSVCAAIRTWAATQRRVAKELGLPDPKLCVVIDYLQRIKLADDAIRRLRSRMGELAEISETLDDLAEREQLAIVCTAMTNGRIGHATAEDATIREAADIEQACDVLIHVDTLGHDKAKALAKIEGIDLASAKIAAHTMKLIYRKGRATGCADASLLYVNYDYQRITTMSDDMQRHVIELLSDDPITWARQQGTKASKRAKQSDLKMGDSSAKDSPFNTPAV